MQIPIIPDAQLPPEPPEEPPVQQKNRLPLYVTIAVAGVIVLALLIWGTALKLGKTIYPNVYVAGIHVGQMERAEAIDAVDEAVEASYSSSTLRVQLPDRTLSFSPEQTNVALDAEDAIDEALSYGRRGGPISALIGYWNARNREHYIDLQTILDLDTDYIRQMIDQVAQEVRMEAEPSTVELSKDEKTLTVQVGYPDRKLDADGLYDAVYEAFVSSDFTPLVWDYEEVPCAPVDLTEYYEKYCTEMTEAYFDEDARKIVEEVPGYGFDLDDTMTRLEQAKPGSKVVIPFGDLTPEVTKASLDSKMFGEKLYSKSTTYVNNANRTTNLRLACEAINGTILKPGDVFSFNDVVGERTEAKGYLPATIYGGEGESVDGIGGGICQVASTIYYATLHMDLKQVQREPHMYAVTYVDLGMDATVYWKSIDYKFENTLDYPIKIQANLDGGTCNITFWGEKPLEKTVKMSYNVLETYPWAEKEELDETKPVGFREEKATPYTGYKVVTYKTIYDADGEKISQEEEAYSTYKKRDHIFVVGPAEEVLPEDPDLPLNPEDPLDPNDPLFPDWEEDDWLESPWEEDDTSDPLDPAW